MTHSLTRRGAMAPLAIVPSILLGAPGLARAASSSLRQPLAVVRVEGRRRALFEVAKGPVTVRDSNVVLGRFEDVFVELDLSDQVRRVTVEAAGRTTTLDLPEDDGPMLGPPLRGGPWAAIYKADWQRGHRRVFYDGRLPGRTAIDWVRLDDQGHIATGDPDLARSALGYGAEVLAVADAVVAAARDGVPEAERVSQNGKHPQDLAAGNYVSLDLGKGRFATCEHLIPGSVAVKPGDRVRKGQVIGQLGFSGDSTGPHLHFHVADAAAPLLGEGVGYGFERFTLLGRYEDLSRLGSTPWTPLASLDPERRNELPGSNVVVRFPA